MCSWSKTDLQVLVSYFSRNCLFQKSIFQAFKLLHFSSCQTQGRLTILPYFQNVIFILQIIKQRIWRHTYQEGLVWNSDPGALLTLPEFSDTLSHFPFHFGEEQEELRKSPAGCEKFTAVIYTTLTSAASASSSKVASGVHLSAPIFKLARNVAASNFAQQVIN